MVRVAKTGVPGITILIEPSMAGVLPARNSVGVPLGMLMLGDLSAASCYRRHAKWRRVVRLLGATFAGLAGGYFGLKIVNDEQFRPIIGAIVLAMLGINYWRTKAGNKNTPTPKKWWFAVALGFWAGVTTMMANAAGLVMVIYLPAMRLPKVEFVGTGGWFFFIINWAKIPCSANLELMTTASVKVDLMMLSFIAAGAAAGILVLKRIAQKTFTAVVQIFDHHCGHQALLVTKPASKNQAKLGLQNTDQKAIITAMVGGETENKFAKARQRMLQWDLIGRDITNPEVLRVMGEIHREEFVPQPYKSQAYNDGPLPIGLGQTISQPYIVALMTQELRLNPHCQVLEIGTGSGYQTAILSKLAEKIYTVERFAELAESARAVLGRLGISNVEFHIGDGSCGWPEQKCFDRIIVTAAVPKIPEPLLEQLADSGLIIAPVGLGGFQQLIVCEKRPDRLVEKGVCDCRFVKLLGKYGFEEG